MINLIINDRVVDKFSAEALRLRFSVRQSLDTGRVLMVNSQNFFLPATGELFEALGGGDLLQKDYLKRLPARLDTGGAVISEGYCQVIRLRKKSNGADELEVIFFGEQADLKALFGTVKLSDIFKSQVLNFTDADLLAFINDPLNYILTEEKAYPLIDYGQNFVGLPNQANRRFVNELQRTDFKPALTWLKILKEGFNYFGLTFDQPNGEVKSIIERVVTPFHATNSPVVLTPITPTINLLEVRLSTNFNLNGNSTNFLDFEGFDDVIRDLGNNYQLGINTFNNNGYLAPVSGIYTVKVTAGFSGQIVFLTRPTTDVFLYVEFVFDKNSDPQNPTPTPLIVASTHILLPNNLITNVAPFTLNFDLPISTVNALTLVDNQNTPDIFLLANQYLFLTNINLIPRDSVWGDEIDFVSFDATYKANNLLFIEQAPAQLAGNITEFDLGRNAPDITFFDFYQSVMQRFCGVPEFNNNAYSIQPYNVWIESNSKTIDGDQLIDQNVYDVFPATKYNNFKSILLTDQSDNDLLNQAYFNATNRIYGQAEITNTGNEFSTAQFKIESKFAPTPIGFIPQTQILAARFITPDGSGLRTKCRYLYFQGVIEVTPITIKDFLGQNILTFNQLPVFGHYSSPFGGYGSPKFDLNFGSNPTFFTTNPPPRDNVFFKYWNRFLQENFSPQAQFIEAKMLLPVGEVFNLKLNERIYFKNEEYAAFEFDNVNAKETDKSDAKLVKRIPFEPISVAPLFPVEITNNVVEWVDVLTGLPQPTPTAPDLELSCNAYGFNYDAVNNLCIFRPQTI